MWLYDRAAPRLGLFNFSGIMLVTTFVVAAALTFATFAFAARSFGRVGVMLMATFVVATTLAFTALALAACAFLGTEQVARINGLQVEAHLGKPIDEVIQDVAVDVVPQLRHVLETGEAILDGELKAETPAHPGESRYYKHNYYPDKSKDGTVVGVSCVVQDITAQKEAELELAKRNKRLEYLALYDALTGLGNRNLFLKQLEHLVTIAGRKEEEVALLAMDLNGFKEVNDRLGHAAGDAVLREFGARLSKPLRQADQKYRIGGDEFAVLLEPRRESLDRALAVAEKIARHLAAPMEIKGHGCSIDVSIGVAVFPQHGRDPNTLLRKADAAMYEAKKRRQVVAGASELDATDVLKTLHSET